MPYRDDVLLVCYLISSSRTYFVALALGVALMLGGPLVLLLAQPLALSQHPMGLVVTALPGLVIVLAYLSSAGAHRVAGGRAEILLYRSHVVVPAAWGTAPLTFSLDGLALDGSVVRGRIYGVRVSEVRRLLLRGDGRARTLSSRMFDDPEALERLASDIERVRAGGEPLVPAAVAAPERARRDRYDDAIDEELSKR